MADTEYEVPDVGADNQALLAMTTDIVASFVTNNAVAAGDLAALILTVHTTLRGLEQGNDALASPKPAVPISQSVTDEHIVCLEDGKTFKTLKRHLRARYNMTPDEYREKWNLPPDYPMVAPTYARRRSELAKDMGLGTGSK